MTGLPLESVSDLLENYTLPTLGAGAVKPFACSEHGATGSAFDSNGGMVFFTLEDESGMAHVTVCPDIYEHIGAQIYNQSALLVSGMTQERGTGTILLALSAEAL